ncbi:MAG: leucine-rich repeat protein [Spirochaetaceae bacterium]|nr:leucine-rich repeat protein [Spirochaetaceae bacterium]
MALCSKCGKELADDVQFCPGCGTPVNGTAENGKTTSSDAAKEKAKITADKAKEYGIKIKAAIDKLPFNNLVDKYADYANYVVCAIGVLLLVVVISAITPDKKGEKSKSGKTAVEKTAKNEDSGKEKVAKEDKAETSTSVKTLEAGIKKELGISVDDLIAVYAVKKDLDEDALAETLSKYELSEAGEKEVLLEEFKKTFLAEVDASDKAAVKQLVNDGKKKVKGAEKEAAQLTSEYKQFLKEAEDELAKAEKAEKSPELITMENAILTEHGLTPEEYITALAWASGDNDDKIVDGLADYIMLDDAGKISWITGCAFGEGLILYGKSENAVFEEGKNRYKQLEKKIKPRMKEHFADQKAKAAKAKRMAAKFDELVQNALTAPATAASNFEYQISKDGKSVVINGLKKDFKGSVLVVPSVIEEMPVKDCQLGSKINCKFLVYQEGIEKVDLPNNCEDVLYMYFPSTVKEFYKDDGSIRCHDMANLLRVDFAPESQLERLPFFYNCENLSSVTLPVAIKNLRAIDDDSLLFKNCGFTSFVVPEGVVTIKNLFNECRKLGSITFPSTLRKMEGNICRCSDELTSLTIPSGVEEIGKWAFISCKKLKTVTLPSSLKKLGDRVFLDCSSLSELVIPEDAKITFGGKEVFKGCSSLPIKTQARLRELGYQGEF